MIKNKSIVKLILLRLVIISLLASIILSFLFSFYSYQLNIKEKREILKKIIEKDEILLKESIWNLDKEFLKNHLIQIYEFNNLSYLKFSGEGFDDFIIGEKENNKKLYEYFNIYSHDAREKLKIGTLELQYSHKKIVNKFFLDFFKYIAFVFLLINFLILYIYYFFKKHIINNLGIITQFFNNLNIDKIENMPFLHGKILNYKEFYTLSSSINKMLEKIKEYQDEINMQTKYIIEANERYRLMIETSHDLIVELDIDGNYKYANDNHKTLLGYDTNYLLNSNVKDFLFEDDKDLYQKCFEDLINKGKANAVIRIYDSNKNIHWINTRSVLYKDDNKERIFVFSQDITEKINFEKNLQESEKQYRLLFNNMAAGFALHEVIFDENNNPINYRYLDVNNVFVEISGKKNKEAIIGKTVLELYPDVEKSWIIDYSAVAIDMVPRRFTRYSKFEDKYFDIIVYSPEYGKFAIIMYDITEMKKYENELLKINLEMEKRIKERTIQLENINKELESFSYSISHDLKAHIRHIESFSKILCEDYNDILDNYGKNVVERIINSTQKMNRLIDDIFNLSKITNINLNFTEFDLSLLAQEVLNELINNLKLTNVNFYSEKDIIIKADRNLIAIVLENLLSNSLKFSAKKDVIDIHLGKIVDNDKKIYFIKDNGVGFDMKYADNLFVPFRRLHDDKEYAGTGIGLSIVQRIINRHNGNIWAKSEIGNGATFYFTLGF